MNSIEFKISGIATEIFDQVQGYTAIIIPKPTDETIDTLEVKVDHRREMFTIYKNLVMLLDDYELVKELPELDQQKYYVILGNITFTDITPTEQQELAYEMIFSSMMNDKLK